jgi:hypothetical protein
MSHKKMSLGFAMYPWTKAIFKPYMSHSVLLQFETGSVDFNARDIQHNEKATRNRQVFQAQCNYNRFCWNIESDSWYKTAAILVNIELHSWQLQVTYIQYLNLSSTDGMRILIPELSSHCLVDHISIHNFFHVL